MKATLAKAPIGIGRIVQCAMYAFLSRDFQLDGKYIQSICKYYRDSECGIQLLLFPEGTDLTANTKAKSHEFSKKNGLECWNQVLRPRSLGFVTFLNNLANDKPDAPQTTSNEEGRKRRESGGKSAVQAVYDLTIAYGYE
jgi:lysocardiolipin and lysophospholipid acyltransferase